MSVYCPVCFRENEETAVVCERCRQDLREKNRNGQLPITSILAGRYTIGKALAQDGFSITYAGQDLRSKENIAVKEYFPDGIAVRAGKNLCAVQAAGIETAAVLQKGLAAFREEIQITKRFRELSSVAEVKDYICENGTEYAVLEALSGKTLDGRGREQLGTAFDRLYARLRPMILDLVSIQREGFVHGDICPSNLLLREDGAVMLLNFGTARLLRADSELKGGIWTRGGFSPLEQYEIQEQRGAWSDVYALCATIYYLLTGHVLQDAPGRLCEDNTLPPSRLGAVISPQQERILMRGISVRGANRYRDIEELMLAFDAARAVRPTAAEGRKKHEKNSRAKRGLLIGSIVAACLAAALAGTKLLCKTETTTFTEESVQAMLYPEDGGDPDYEKLYAILSEQGEAGNGLAMYYLGLLYENGWGRAVEWQTATEWYRKAAEAGESAACLPLAILLERNAEEAEAAEWYRRAAETGEAAAYLPLARLLEKTENYTEAIGWYERAIEREGREALSAAARLYEEKLNDYNKAFACYNDLAEAGDTEALFRMAVFYEEGKGVDRNYGEALARYEKADDVGHVEAAKRIGRLYENGKGVDLNWEKAFSCYEEAVNNGSVDALNDLGRMYQKGLGVEMDRSKAMDLYREAADMGNTAAMVNLGKLLGSAGGADPEQAREWFEKAEEMGNTKGLIALAEAYLTPERTKEETARALSYLEKAADCGDTEAMERLSILYRQEASLQDPEQSRAWAQKGAEMGDAGCMNQLGILYREGFGTEQKDETAMEWFMKAAEQDYADSYFRIGAMCREGNGVAADEATAFEWYLKAARRGHRKAAIQVSECYREGIGTAKDPEQAAYWEQLARQLSDAAI